MIKFTATGVLNIASDPSDLPQESDGKTVVSGAMTRCTNLHRDQGGVAKTRFGSAKLSATQLATPIHRVVEMAGNRYTFASTLIYKNEASHGTGYTSARWSVAKYNPFNVTTQSIFACNGTDRVKVDASGVNNWGIAAPTTAPTVITGTDEAGQGSATQIGVKYTYVEKSGSTVVAESNPSAATAQQAMASDPLHITWTASSDSRVTHVRIYRTTIGGTDYLYMDEVAIGTTYWTGTVAADSTLGTEVATNHDRPPSGMTVISGPDFNGTMFGADGTNKLYYSLPKQPEYWPAAYYVECGPPQYAIKSIVLFGGQAYAITTNEIYQIQGTGANSFFPLRMSATTGSIAERCALAVKGKGIYHVSTDGIYLYNGSTDQKITDTDFEPIWRGETVGSIRGLNRDYATTAFLALHRNKVYYGYPGGSNTTPSDFLVLNLETGMPTHYQYSSNITDTGVDLTNDRVIAGDADGYMWEIEKLSATDDGGTAIDWQIQSKDFSDQVRRYFPRWARYDVGITSGSATGKIILDGTILQSHTLTDRGTKKRLVTTGNGRRVAIRITGSGVATVYHAEVD